MTRAVTFSSRGLYGCESFRDCFLTEIFREKRIGAILLTIINSNIIWFRPRFKPQQLVAPSYSDVRETYVKKKVAMNEVSAGSISSMSIYNIHLQLFLW